MPNARNRNTSPYEFFLQTARSHQPRLGFGGTDFAEWQATTRPAVLATLGSVPPAADLAAELVAEWDGDGLHWQRWIVDVWDGFSAVVYVLRSTRPVGSAESVESAGSAGSADGLPAILCWHGHTRFGKEAIVGNRSTPELRQIVADSQTSYGEAMARAGFVTVAVDWMGRGDLDDDAKPNHRALARGRDWCNLYYLHATLLGMTPLGLNLAIGRAALTLAAGLPFVDGRRLGVMGLSGGGTLALWTALTDERITAAEIVCYSDLFADFGFRDINYCGSQVAPGLFELVDLPDLQGLLAPLPLLVDVGAFDQCFRVESALDCHRRVREIYSAAGAADRLQLELAPTGHGWGGGRSVRFFEEHLSVTAGAARPDGRQSGSRPASAMA